MRFGRARADDTIVAAFLLAIAPYRGHNMRSGTAASARFLPAGKRNFIASDESCPRSEEHTSELQSLMRISYAVFCLKKKKTYCRHQTCTTTTTYYYYSTNSS